MGMTKRRLPALLLIGVMLLAGCRDKEVQVHSLGSQSNFAGQLSLHGRDSAEGENGNLAAAMEAQVPVYQEDVPLGQSTDAADRELTMMVATDIHYLATGLRDDGTAFRKFVESGDGKQLYYSEAMMKAFTADIIKNRPQVLVLSGDLTNNGERESHRELAGLLQKIEAAGTAVYVIPGNHDIINPWAQGFKGTETYRTESVSAPMFADIYKPFGYGEAVSRDTGTLSYLAAASPKLWLLMLDTNQYGNNEKRGYPQTDGRISRETLEWMSECSRLAKEQGAVLLPVMHHSLMDHSAVTRVGYTLNDNRKVLEWFRANEAPLALTGHIHIQDICADEENGSTLYDIATGALSVYPHQYGSIRYQPQSGALDYTSQPLAMEQWAAEQGLEDEKLLRFDRYSAESFGLAAFLMSEREMNRNELYAKYSEAERRSMSEVIQRLSFGYFAGRENAGTAAIRIMEGYALWSAAPAGFLKRYVYSTVEDTNLEDNQLQINLRTPVSTAPPGG